MNREVSPNPAPTLFHVSTVQALRIEGIFQRPVGGVPFLATISLYGLLAAGTGGVISSNNASELRNWTNWPVVEVRTSSKSKSESPLLILSVAEHLQTVRDCFGLKMSEIAQIFGVSRQAAYSWLSGANPKAEIATKIWRLSKVASEFRAIGVKDLGNLAHRPILEDGRSLLSVLLAGDPLDEVIACVKAGAEEVTRMRSRAYTRNSGTFDERRSSFVELVLPVLEEHNR